MKLMTHSVSEIGFPIIVLKLLNKEQDNDCEQRQLKQGNQGCLGRPGGAGSAYLGVPFQCQTYEIIRSGNTISVVGGDDRYISRRRRGRPNDRIFYEFDKTENRIRTFDIEIERG
jgi:hypothetical protein